ncbi:chymotrypsin-like protease CTRL-1 [Drosophila kikkawai]|uniref:Chymotrypsin-like protease CTRL-1 n=1 Tax=Drosophila kikkawai TaxID=30033 RepID=A0ABM3C7Q6_DROKI|nr:chymotrypsin-like protease CTRL-1 [Drosophila kikkawai]
MNTKAVGIKIFASLQLLVAFLQPGTAQFLDPNCGVRSPSIRIINGDNATMTSSPWMVFILTNDGLVLTAAHCLKDHKHLKVRMGEYNRDLEDMCHNTVDGDLYCTKRVELDVDMGIAHPSFDSKTMDNDIAILLLDRRVEYTDNIKPICIVTDKRWRNTIDQIPILTITGWGLTEAHGRTSRILQTLEISRLYPEECTRWVPKTPSDNEFCLGNMDSGACNGDSGGPAGKLISYRKKRRFIQIGIASLTNSQCKYATTYTDVLSHVDWILGVNAMYGLSTSHPPPLYFNDDVE